MGERKTASLLARARSAGEESSLELLSAVSIHCWDVSAGSDFGVFL